MGMSMDKGPIVMMGKWMPKKGTMIMAYGGYIKENKKVPLGGFTLNHNFDKGSFGVAKRLIKILKALWALNMKIVALLLE